MNANYKFVLCFFITVILMGCDSKPNELDISKGLDPIYKCKYLTVDNVKKINGKKIDENNYDVEFTYDINANQTEMAELLRTMRNNKDDGLMILLSSCSLHAIYAIPSIITTPIVSGEGRATMEKTENGWRMTDKVDVNIK